MTTPLIPTEPIQEELLKSIAVGTKRTMEYAHTIKNWLAFIGWILILTIIMSMFGCFFAVMLP